MANFKYNRSISTTLSVTGFYNAEKMTIDDGDGNVRSLKTLLQEFEGTPVKITCVLKADEELDEPKSE